MTLAELYATVRARLLSLAAGLDEQQAATAVPALPGWTVKDTYAHLAGVCADILNGRIREMRQPGWTVRHLAERRDHDLSAVCAEWGRTGPELEALMRGPDGDRMGYLATEVWSHEHDIRAALGRPALHGDPTTASVAERVVAVFQQRWPDAGLPVLRLVGGDREWQLGAGEPAVTLRTSEVELIRVLVGRRSRGQVLAMDWMGDPETVLDQLHLFPLPDHALHE